jgi:hypothetical protein
MITASAVPLGAPRGLFVVAARAVHTNKKNAESWLFSFKQKPTGAKQIQTRHVHI